MRQEGRIPHPKIAITVFRMNDRFIVKMEAGEMEQSFKFRAEEVGSWENLAAYFDEPFMNKVIQRFNEMFLEMKRVKEKESK